MNFINSIIKLCSYIKANLFFAKGMMNLFLFHLVKVFAVRISSSVKLLGIVIACWCYLIAL